MRSRGRSGRFATILASVGMGAACGEAPDAAGRVEVIDSAGVRIVSNGPLQGGDTLVAVGAEPILEIGALGGDEAYQLFLVSDAVRLDDGTVVVANAGSREVKVYEADGSHRTTFGGAGRGPSEFGYPAGILPVGPDTVMVFDRLDRVTFTTSGEFVGRITHRPEDLDDLIPGGFVEGGMWLPDGSLAAPIHQRQAGPPSPGPRYRPRMTFVRVRPEAAEIDTLGVFGGVEQQFVAVAGAEWPRATVPPFATNTWWSMKARDGSVLLADNAEPQVRIYGPDGGLTLVRWRAEPEPVRADEVERVLDAWRTGWASERLEENERLWAGMDVPDTKPYYVRAFHGRDGSVWVVASDPTLDPTTAYLVFGADGIYRGRATFPDRFMVEDAGPDWVLGVARDENDVEVLRMYALEG
ncbi:MAG: hypothetical protein RJQ04_02995 [Longimicrobiales bacterium]